MDGLIERESQSLCLLLVFREPYDRGGEVHQLQAEAVQPDGQRAA